MSDQKCKEQLQKGGEAKNPRKEQADSCWPNKCTVLGIQRSPNERKLFWILSVLTVVLCITLLILTITWQKNRKQALEQKHEKVCFDCEKITTEHKEFQNLAAFRMPGSNNTQCCGYLEDILDVLVHEAVQQRYNSEVIPRYTFVEKCENQVEQETPAANLIDIDKKTVHSLTSGAFLVGMKKDAPSFIHSNLKYENGKFVINASGYYFVYSQLQMKINSTNVEGPLFNHYVYHYSHKMNRQELLLENMETPCKSQESSLEMTSSIGAVFKLDELDMVYVAMTHPQYLQTGHSNVFNVRLISSL